MAETQKEREERVLKQGMAMGMDPQELAQLIQGNPELVAALTQMATYEDEMGSLGDRMGQQIGPGYATNIGPYGATVATPWTTAARAFDKGMANVRAEALRKGQRDTMDQYLKAMGRQAMKGDAQMTAASEDAYGPPAAAAPAAAAPAAAAPAGSPQPGTMPQGSGPAAAPGVPAPMPPQPAPQALPPGAGPGMMMGDMTPLPPDAFGAPPPMQPSGVPPMQPTGGGGTRLPPPMGTQAGRGYMGYAGPNSFKGMSDEEIEELLSGKPYSYGGYRR